jgi:T5SS/PEP-CTERM-associated repeat protein
MPATAAAVTSNWTNNSGGSFTTAVNWAGGVPDSSDIAMFDRGNGVAYTVTFAPQRGLTDITSDRLVIGSNTVTFDPAGSGADYFLDNPATIEADPILQMPHRGITIGAEANDTAAALISHLSLLQAAAATLGHDARSHGTLTLDQNNDLFNVTGGSTDAELIIGRLGTGVLNVLAGADVTVNGEAAGFPAGGISLGRRSSGRGTANISGAGSTLDTNLLFAVGDGGTGTLNVTAGGHVENLSGIVANLAGSTGTANISGIGSTWSNALLFIGEAGQGTLNIMGGGVVNSQSASMAGQSGSTSAVNLSAAGSAWNITNGNFHIGLRGDATLSIADASHVNSDTSIIGDLAGSQGTVTVSGAGSTWNGSSTLVVGDNGSGVLRITSGGKVISTAPMFGTAGYLARETGSTGNVRVDGAAATWTNAGLLIVGGDGNATLDVTAGGRVNSQSGRIAGRDDGSGVVTVAGAGSRWMNADILSVGDSGTGTLNVKGGGTVESIGGAVGELSGSTGHVIVDGINSMWSSSNILVVGDFGNGRLDIKAGGHVASTNGYIGALAGSTGIVLVDGAGSLWTVNGNLVVGNMGQGTLTVQNGGLVDVEGDATFNGSSTATMQFAAIGGNVGNGGQLNFRLDCMDPAPLPPMDPAIDISGDLTNDGTIDVRFDCMDVPLPPGVPPMDPLRTIAVGRGITNNGTFKVANADEQNATIQLGAGHSFTNNASGVVDLLGPTDVNGDGTIVAKHIVGGNVVNRGKMYIRTNAQIAGSLTMAIDADLLVDPASPCCGMVLDINGGVTNRGQVTLKNSMAMAAQTTLEVGNGETFTNEASGVLAGTGTIAGNVLNRGEVRPGNSTGLLTVTGDYMQVSGGKLVVEIGGTTAGSQHDQLAIGGDVALGGLVEVLFADGFSPQPGNRFEIVTTTESLSGAFVGAALPGLPAGMDWNIEYGTRIVSLVTTIAGDYTSDGRVDAADYVVWRNTLGQGVVQGFGADGDASGTIDDGDFTVWRASFGTTAAGARSSATGSASAAIPEPASLGLFLVAAIIGAHCRPRRRDKLLEVTPWRKLPIASVAGRRTHISIHLSGERVIS